MRSNDPRTERGAPAFTELAGAVEAGRLAGQPQTKRSLTHQSPDSGNIVRDSVQVRRA